MSAYSNIFIMDKSNASLVTICWISYKFRVPEKKLPFFAKLIALAEDSSLYTLVIIKYSDTDLGTRDSNIFKP